MLKSYQFGPVIGQKKGDSAYQWAHGGGAKLLKTSEKEYTAQGVGNDIDPVYETGRKGSGQF